MSYDTWLEAPYQRAAEEGDAYVSWCEDNDLDPDDDHWDAFQSAMDDAQEDAMVSAAEARRDDYDDER